MTGDFSPLLEIKSRVQMSHESLNLLQRIIAALEFVGSVVLTGLTTGLQRTVIHLKNQVQL
jgi:hypothetical protein